MTGNVRLLAVGDISLESRSDINPLSKVINNLRDKDILFGNLETVLTNNNCAREKAVLLRSDPEKVLFLKEAGFDIVNIGNNHIYDYGSVGFFDTIELLGNNGIAYIGGSVSDAPKSKVFHCNGIDIGFLGYTDCGYMSSQKENICINEMNLSAIIADINCIRKECDFVILSLHWGYENVNYPSPNQIKLAHELIDNGVSVILGHHPHVLQGLEKYNNGLIAYSLGNFQFNQEKSQTKENVSIILEVVLEKNKTINYDTFPIVIDENYMPSIDKDSNATKLLQKISVPIMNGSLTWMMFLEELAPTHLMGNIRSWVRRIKIYGFSQIVDFILWLASPFVVLCVVVAFIKPLKRFMRLLYHSVVSKT